LSTTGSKKTGPRRVRPKTKTAEPKHAQLLNKKDNPKCRKSKTNKASSKQLALCTKSDDPRHVLSVTNSKDTGPTRDSPSNKSTKSSCVRECGDRLKPKCKKSSTDIVKPEQARLLRKGGRPVWTKSKVNISSSIQEMPQTKGVLPALARLRIEKERSNCPRSKVDKNESSLAKLWIDRGGSKVVTSSTDIANIKPDLLSPEGGAMESR
jgi:hypothetical protein